MFPVAMEVLSVPASSSPVERVGTLGFYNAMIGDARPNLKNTGERNIICAAASGLKIFKFFCLSPNNATF